MGETPPRRAPGQRPRMLVCYLCSKEYGSQRIERHRKAAKVPMRVELIVPVFDQRSLPIHIPQCQKRWLQEEEQKPKKDRRQLPLPPEREPPVKTGGGSASRAQEIDDFNDEARAAFEASLEQCSHCQRRFVPTALKYHSKACTAANPAKPAGTGLTPMSLTNRLVPGAIAGSQHGNATEQPPPLYRMTAKQWKQFLKKQGAPGARSPRGRDPSLPAPKDSGQSSKSRADVETKPWLGKNKAKLVVDTPVEIKTK